jgi:magnesium-transporting ATPase (P-type)
MEDLGGIEAIAKGLDSRIGDGPKGITGNPNDERDRKSFYGVNAFPPPKIKTILELIVENFEDPINVILCGAALVSVIIGIIKEGFPDGLTEGLSIMIALVIIIVVNSGNNYASER